MIFPAYNRSSAWPFGTTGENVIIYAREEGKLAYSRNKKLTIIVAGKKITLTNDEADDFFTAMQEVIKRDAAFKVVPSSEDWKE